jgi:hypothetical protein
MKTLILPTFVLLCFAVNLAAQEKHPIEASGGVSAFSLGDEFRRESYGWNVGFGIGVHRNISIVAELSGYTEDSDYVHKPGIRFCFQTRCPETYVPAVRVRHYLIGPRFSLPIDNRFQIFAHALAGRMTKTIDGDSNSGIGLGLGGGVETRFSKYLVGRIFVDWLPGKVQSTWETKSTRLAIGLVFRPFQARS